MNKNNQLFVYNLGDGLSEYVDAEDLYPVGRIFTIQLDSLYKMDTKAIARTINEEIKRDKSRKDAEFAILGEPHFSHWVESRTTNGRRSVDAYPVQAFKTRKYN